MVLKDCNSPFTVDTIDHEEYKVLLLRAGMDPNNFDSGLEICTAHRALLGKNFNAFVHINQCLYNGHLDSRTKRGPKNLQYGTQISYNEAHDHRGGEGEPPTIIEQQSTRNTINQLLKINANRKHMHIINMILIR